MTSSQANAPRDERKTKIRWAGWRASGPISVGLGVSERRLAVGLLFHLPQSRTVDGCESAGIHSLLSPGPALAYDTVSMSTQSLPSSSSRKSGLAVPILVGVVLVCASTGVGLWLRSSAKQSAVVNVAPERLFEVRKGKLDVVVSSRGEIQAVDNIELMSTVEGRSTVTNVVPDGTSVKAGDVVVELDSSGIRQQIDDATIELQRAQASLANATTSLKIQQSNNEAELEGAKVALTLAEIELKKYVEGNYPQQLEAAKTKLQMAQTNLAQRTDDLAQTRGLFQRGFVTAAEVKKQENNLAQAQADVRAAQNDLKVLTEYQHVADLASRNNAVAQAKNKVERVIAQNESTLIQKGADLKAAEQALETRERRLAYLKDQLEACKVIAPADGLVVYVPPRDGSQPLAVGVEVRERQALVRLPDTTRMKAIIRVSEGLVAPIRVGQTASIRLNSNNQFVDGQVIRVSLMADSSNSFSRWGSDTKEYPVDIELKTATEGLKPGMSVDADIFIARLSDVLTVPIRTLYSVGPATYVFVKQGEEFVPKQVALGLTGKTDVQIRGDAIKEGDQILVLQPNEGKALLDRAGIKIDEAAAQQRGRGEGSRGENGRGEGGRRGRDGATTRPTENGAGYPTTRPG
jgi:HlyD family secretion protein